jgi:hypothetical protein
MIKEQASVSLYDHLGYAAGIKLGEEVYKAAKSAKEPVNTRFVSNKAYKGKVMLYREEFLKEYFNGKRSN